jgi:branched-chain amino acid transport system substrate-binding protein
VRQMRDQGMKTQLMSGDALVTDEYWQITGDAGEGTLMTFAPDPRKNPAAAAVVKEFQDKKIDPEGYVLYTYAAVQVWAQAATMAKSTDYDKVVAMLKDTSFDTVLGPIKFDAKGDVVNPAYVFYIWHAGKYSEM